MYIQINQMASIWPKWVFFLAVNISATIQTPYKLLKQKNMCFILFLFPAGIYMFKVNNRNIRIRCEICSKLTIKTRERPFGNPSIGISASASASAFKYKLCLLHNINHVLSLCIYFYHQFSNLQCVQWCLMTISNY